jgi:hypothetical protein
MHRHSEPQAKNLSAPTASTVASPQLRSSPTRSYDRPMPVLDRHANLRRPKRDRSVITREDAWAGFLFELLPLPIAAFGYAALWIADPDANEFMLVLTIIGFAAISLIAGQGWWILGDWRPALIALSARVSLTLVWIWLAARIDDADYDVATMLGAAFGLSIVAIPIASSLLLAFKWWPLTADVNYPPTTE